MSEQALAERRGLLSTFVVFGVFWGSWSAVLPDVRVRSGLSDSLLGLALAAVAVAAVPAMPLAGRLADSGRARRLLPGALAGFAVVVAVLGTARGPLTLVAGLVLLGVATGVLDVAANVATAAWERVEGRPLMAAAHGCFSVGVLTGAVLTGLARNAGAGPPVVLGVVAAGLLLAAGVQPSYRPPVHPASQQGEGRRRLAPVLLALGALVAGSFLLEDAVTSWSALHLERTLGAAPWQSGLGPGLFAGAMATGRFAVHSVARPGQEARTVTVGGLGLALGLLLFGLAPDPALALVGTVLAGAGVSVLAPTLFSAVGARSAAGRQGADLALVTAFGYAGFVTGPVVVGLLSGATSLRVALALLAVAAVAVAAGGAGLLRRSPEAFGAPDRGRVLPTSTTRRS